MLINEIFYSIQGEGRYTGTPAVFVRFSGCNLRCDFCDTEHQSGVEMSESDIVQAVSKYPTRHVILTGGEPTLQITQTLLRALVVEGKIIHIETNGTNPIPYELRKFLHWVTVSPKFGRLPKIERIDELKVVFDTDHTEWLEQYCNIPTTGSDNHYLQPCDRQDSEINKRNLNECINYIKSNPQWKLSYQLHKTLGLQ